jgi:senataxin
MALRYYDSFETILQPRLSKVVATDREEVLRVMAKYRVNEPQAVAIASSLNARGFVLIQGYVGCLAMQHHSPSHSTPVLQVQGKP